MKFTPSEINFIQDRAHERVTEIFDALGCDYSMRNDYIQCGCPIHGSDNPRSLYWALSSSHWKCMTRRCHEEIISGPSTSIFGLVRGAMTTKTGEQWSFPQSVMFVVKALNLQNVKIDDHTEDDIQVAKFVKEYRQRRKIDAKQQYQLLADVLPSLQPDTIYYPMRGVSENTIAKYHISYCGDQNRPFAFRAFFPILDPLGRHVVGWSARTVWDKCRKCSVYHSVEFDCPPKEKRLYYGKWKHSKGFQAERHLYNYWLAKPFIAKTGTAILCEGAGNCWALDACGITNSVAMFGLSLSKHQRSLLQQAGALTLIVALDNDEEGEAAKKRMEEQLQYYFRIFFVSPDDVNDIGDMVPDDIQKMFGEMLKKTSREKLLAKE